jgi:hypothetical protein
MHEEKDYKMKILLFYLALSGLNLLLVVTGYGLYNTNLIKAGIGFIFLVFIAVISIYCYVLGGKAKQS